MGLYCRKVAQRLPWEHVRLRHFVTLATPHLGGVGESRLAPLVSSCSRTVQDLTYQTRTLQDMHDSSALEALRRFDVRIAYAPIIYDGIVSWNSAAMTGGMPKGMDGKILRICADPCESLVIGSPENEALQALRSIPWTVVDVDLNHRNMATLRSRTNKSHSVSDTSIRLVQDPKSERL